jgi:flagellum-specific peptidoglycan hydrolase FlgJ
MYTYETDEHLRGMAIAAVKAEKLTGYPPVVLLSQFAIESSWGQKVTGDFNYWGIKRAPEQGPAKLCPTTEDMASAGFHSMRDDERNTVTRCDPLGNGITRYHMSCWFAQYASFDESVAAYIAFILGNSRYRQAWKQYQATKDADGLLRGIAQAGYATGGGYADLLLSIAHQQNIQHAITEASNLCDGALPNAIVS